MISSSQGRHNNRGLAPSWNKVSGKCCASILKGEGDIYYLGKVGEKSRIIFVK